MSRCRVYSLEFKQRCAAPRNGESVAPCTTSCDQTRVLYRWRDVYRKEGAAGLHRPPPPPGNANPPRPMPHRRNRRAALAELERKIGQQALDLDFLRRAFKRVKESRQKNTGLARQHLRRDPKHDAA